MLRILYVGAYQVDRPDINIPAEVRAIQGKTAISPDVVLEAIVNPDLAELSSKLTEFDPDVVHFGCHGDLHQGVFVIVDHQKRPIPLADEQLAPILAERCPNLGVVILNSCFGAPLAEHLVKDTRFDCVIHFNDAVIDAEVPGFVRNLYDGLLNNSVQGALRNAAIVANGNPEVFWNNARVPINARPLYRLCDPEAEPLREGQIVEGKLLVRRCYKSELGSMWEVSDPADGSDRQFRFYLDPRNFQSRRRSLSVRGIQLGSEISDALNSVDKLFPSDPRRVFSSSFKDLNCPNPYVDYRISCIWKPLSQFNDELHGKPQRALQTKAELDEVNRIMFQMVEAISFAHNAPKPIVHGRLNVDGTIVTSRDNLKAATFGESRPIVTDYGLFYLASTSFKGRDFCSSPSVISGNHPTTADDVYSLAALWYWLLTGHEPEVSAVLDTTTWFTPLLNLGLDFQVVNLITEVLGRNRPRQISDLSTLFNNTVRFPQNQRSKPAPEPPTFNSLGMEFSLVPSHHYLVGTPDEEPGRGIEPLREQIYLRSYFIGRCVVSVGDILAISSVTSNNVFRSMVTGYERLQRNLPATCVFQNGAGRPMSWQFARMLCAILTALPNEKMAGRRYFLPTELEWEVACRAGTTTPFNTGRSTLTAYDANFNILGNGPRITAVDDPAFPPNDWNLRHMHGNVWEFCEDFGGFRIQRRSDPDQTPFWKRRIARYLGTRRGKVIRGGDFQSSAQQCRSSHAEILPDEGGLSDELHEPRNGKVIGIRLVFLDAQQRADHGLRDD